MSSVKIAANMAAVAHHIIDGAVTFPYAVDAHSAVARFPLEWSFEPWSIEETSKAMEDHGIVVEPLTPEEQAAVDEHARAVAEANERLKAFRDKQAAEKELADQAAADEAIVKSPSPVKRPFGRKGKPTEAELKMIKAKKDADDLAAAERAGAKLTG
jgi:hypothetical protein